jgi:hypothetical protein
MRRFRTIIYLIFIFSVNAFTQSKFSINGTITDNENGESLLSATISVKELAGTGTVSNEYGFYSITLPEGNYTLVVNFIGYETIEKAINLNQNQQIDFVLNPESITTSQIEVIAERKNDNITNTEIGVEKLDVREIKKIPILFGEQDIIKTLQLLPGVKSTGEGSGGLFVRGGDNSQNLILLDEAIVYNPAHLLGFFSTFNSDALKDVALYKGTAPAEYGGRISSVLDVKMNEGNNKKFHFGGGIGIISSRIYVEGPIVKDRGSFLVSGRRTYADLFLKLSSDTTLNNNQLYFYDLNVKANFKIDNKNKIYLSGYFGRDVFKFQERFGINWGNLTGTLRWNHLWNEKLFSNTSLIYSDYDYKISIFRPSGGFSLASAIRNLNLKHEFQYFHSPEHNFKFGFNSTYHRITPGQVEVDNDTLFNPIELQDRYAWENAIYFSGSWKPKKFLNIEYGIRLSSFSLLGEGDFFSYDVAGNVSDTTSYKSGQFVQTYFNPEPRLNMSFIINDRNSIKLSYTRNAQNLHLINNSTSSTPTDIWLASSKNVKPEIGDQVNLGYFFNFRKDMFQLSAEVYYKYMQNQIDLKNGAEIRANELIEGELSYGIGRAYGLELLLRKKYGKLTGWLSYTLSRTERLIAGVNNNNWYPARQDATHDISAVAIYDFNSRWSVSAIWVYRTGNAVTYPSGMYRLNGDVQFYYTERNGYRMPAYHRMDLGATYNFKKKKRWESSLNFSVYNVYGQKNPYSINFEEDPDNPNKIQAVKIYLFRFIPSITYNFKF